MVNIISVPVSFQSSVNGLSEDERSDSYPVRFDCDGTGRLAMRRTAFKRGERIFTKGEPSDLAFLILSGKIEIVFERGQAADVVASLEPGEVFGEMGLIDSGPRSASARAAADSVCLAVNADELLTMIETDPKEAVAFVKTLIRRLRAADARLESVTVMATVGAG